MQHRVINKNLSYESPPGPPLYTNNTKFVKRLKQLNFSKSCPNLLDHHRTPSLRACCNSRGFVDHFVRIRVFLLSFH